MDLKRNEYIEAKSEIALGVFLKYKRGQTVPHSVLAKAVGHAPSNEDKTYYRIVNKSRDKLRNEYGITTTDEPTVGYLLYTVEQTLTVEPKKRNKRACNQLGKSIRAVSTIPDAEMTPNQQRLQQARIEAAKEDRRKIAMQEAFIEEGKKSRPFGDDWKRKLRELGEI